MRGFDKKHFPIPIFSLLLQFSIISSLASPTITRNQWITDQESLVSENEIFELGFFSLANSTQRYLGIWYRDIEPRTIVWVANREKPVLHGHGSLKIADDGNLVLVDGENVTIWSTEAKPESNNTVVSLLDEGNLVLVDSDTRKPYWESFNNPTDTYLPGMRAQVNPSKGENRAFVPWSSESDPSPGRYSMGIDPNGPPQIVTWEGQKRKWRSGQWNSMIFTGVPDMHRSTNYLYGFKLSSPPDPDGSVYFTYVPSESSDLLRFVIRFDGIEEQFRWNKESNKWTLIQRKPGTECEKYNHCGNNSVCNDNGSGKCSCIDGFEPVFLKQWNNGNFSGGCQRRVLLKCQLNNESRFEDIDDGFKGLKSMKLPDFGSVVLLDDSKSCKDMCLRNCSCNAYADVSGIGCMIWNDDLVDLQRFNNGGSLLNVRLAGSELGTKKVSNLVIIVVCIIGSFLLILSTGLLWRFRKSIKAALFGRKKDLPATEMSKNIDNSTEIQESVDKIIEGDEGNAPDLPIFNFNFVASATGSFAEENKLGEGGFGTVYKGKLVGGQEIAVKRLSGKSRQGLEEFKNEIKLIAKLQHRNLVRLLGCCIQGDEKMLVYEYMPNKSLDSFLFDKIKQPLLDWEKRFMIIEGIARGLLYLHRDSRLKIIHRDLKASNILLDSEMIPKISDFGMARIFDYHQDEANTMRVVGTYGYMAPEYAMEGLFSEKSDVYSFGVLLLEVISGRKNVSFRYSEDGSLIGHAWSLWSQGRAMELIDPTVKDSCKRNEALRCIHVGMLCVQDSATHRPNMATVVLMLESQTQAVPLPRQPTFHSFRGSESYDVELNFDGQDVVSVNEITLTTVAGR